MQDSRPHALVVVRLAVHDAHALADYQQQARVSMAPFGAEPLFTGAAHNLEGADTSLDRVAIFRFPSAEAARSWHASDAYQALVSVRERAMRASFTLCSQEAS